MFRFSQHGIGFSQHGRNSCCSLAGQASSEPQLWRLMFDGSCMSGGADLSVEKLEHKPRRALKPENFTAEHTCPRPKTLKPQI